MKVGFIFILYHTPHAEIVRLKQEIKQLKVTHAELIFVDNTESGDGYAQGVNKGLEQARQAGCDVFVVANPDISFQTSHGAPLSDTALEQALSQYDIVGFSLVQQSKTYYGGVIDPLRMSGGLNTKKPAERFMDCDFVSGSLMVLKKTVVDTVGPWDTSYEMYYEDVDYCIRARQTGFKTGIDTSVYYEHFETSDTNENKKFYLARNRLKILGTYGSLKARMFELIRSPLTLIEEFPLLIRLIKKRNFLINFASLSVSSFLNKLLTFLLFIVLVGILTPAQYGIYTLVWAHVTLLGPFLDLGTTSYGILYSPTQPIAQVAPVLSLRLLLSVVVYAVTGVLAYMFRYDHQVVTYILLTGAAIFFNAVSGSYLIFHSVKQSSYKPALVSLLFNALLVVTLILVLSFKQSLFSLFLATGILYGGFSIILGYILYKSLPIFSIDSFNLAKWWPIVSKSFVFVLIGVCATMYYKIDVFLLNAMRGQSELGVYSSGYKFFDAFMFLAASYNIAASPRFAQAERQDRNLLKTLIRKDLRYLALLGVLIALGVLVTAPFFLSFLKSDYSQAIPILQIVIVALPFILCASVFYNALYVLNKAYVVLYIFAIQAVLNAVLNYLFIPSYGAFASASITVLSEILNLLCAWGVVMYLLRKKHENIN